MFGLGLAGTSGDPGSPDDAGRARLAAACVRAENEIAGAPTGGMDQSVSLRATPGHALELDCRDLSVRQVPFDLAAHDLALLVIDTRAEHALVDGQYAARRATCEAAARRLYCHRHTLRYRIRKIEELTGRDLTSARDRIEFWLALRGRELVTNQ